MEKAKIVNRFDATNEGCLSIDFNGFNYLVIYGDYVNGGWFAIINHGVSGDLSYASDVFYNSESIGRALNNFKAGKQIAEVIAADAESKVNYKAMLDQNDFERLAKLLQEHECRTKSRILIDAVTGKLYFDVLSQGDECSLGDDELVLLWRSDLQPYERTAKRIRQEAERIMRLFYVENYTLSNLYTMMVHRR